MHDEELAERLHGSDLFPTSEVVSQPQADVNHREWDLLVTDNELGTSSGFTPLWEPSPRMHVISFSRDVSPFFRFNIGSVARLTDDVRSTAAWEGRTPAMELVVPGGLSNDLERLVERDLLPMARQAEGVPHLAHGASKKYELRALLLTRADELVAAAFLTRYGGKAEILSLPPGISMHEEWIIAAMRRWRTDHPVRFQHLPDWRSAPQWATHDEHQLIRQLDDLEEERRKWTEEYLQRKERLEADLRNARQTSEVGQRRLLTAVSDELSAAVAHAFAAMGFEVTDRDQETPSGKKLEDLQLRDPDDPDWIALVEVRGYTGGGATPKDLSRLTKFEVDFTAEHGSRPSTLWYVVNQFAGRDPELRPPVLHNEQATLDSYAEDHNLLALDTADLFRLVVALDEGQVDTADLRASLRAHKGRYTADIGPSSDE